jgi:hypothetical protein
MIYNVQERYERYRGDTKVRMELFFLMIVVINTGVFFWFEVVVGDCLLSGTGWYWWLLVMVFYVM